MKSSNNHKIKNRETPNDVFYTPKDLVKTHLEIIKPMIKEKDIIFEPFFGSGNYFNMFKDIFTKKNSFIWSEIALQKDFFKHETEVDVIVSNPPYSIMNKVLEHSIKLKPRIISYLIGINNLTPKRIEMMNEAGYKLVHMHMTKVYSWYGMTVIATFSKEGENCISYDRTIYKTDKNII
jgi:type I restriction-modification system DNA methylase subunit